MMNKKGQKGSPWPFIVLAVIAMVLFYEPIANMVGGGAKAPEEQPPVDIGYVCPVDTTQLAFAPADFNNPGTLVYVDARYWIDTVPKGVTNTSETPDASPGDKLEVWFAEGDATYYGSYYDGEAAVPCKGTFTIPGTLWVKESAPATMLELFDKQNKAVGTEANITMDPGDEQTVKLEVDGKFEEYYGNPEVELDNLLVAEYNPSEIADFIVEKDGVELTESSSIPLVETASTGNREIGFLMPKSDGSLVTYTITVLADQIDEPDAGDTVVLKIYDADYFYNSDSGKIDSGWEDEAHNDIGLATEPSATIYLE